MPKMMGDIRHKPHAELALGRRWIAGIATSALLAIACPAMGADALTGEPVRETPVSTSPVTPTSADAPALRVAGARVVTPLPLTRAAARKQIEVIDPARWLARFGRVDIETRR